MISFFYESVEFDLDEKSVVNWLLRVLSLEKKKEGEVNFIFCTDDYLLKINRDFLDHDTYTDVIGFDNSLGNELHGDVFISYERVIENARSYKVEKEEELRRVIVHGILHFCGYKDKTDDQRSVMRGKENQMLKLFDVEQF